jgi:exodeoxyribonuclease VII large subunit
LTDLALTPAWPQGGAAVAALSVSQLAWHLGGVLAADAILADVWVRGEISNLTRPASGHLYFGLKDSGACVNCVMWRTRVASLPFRPEVGAQVLVHGQVGIYERRSEYQLVVSEVQPDGLGALYLALEQLKARLEGEGLFALERKRPLPRFPQRIAIVTSPTGAALQDMCAVLRRSPFSPEIVVVPAVVQGEMAAASVAAAIELANQRSGADVLIVGRGGGSAEDLWPFNDERLVRAITASRIPVIAAVGHETDYTLADFAADERSLTPTAAAERLLDLRGEQLAVLAAAPTALRRGLEAAVERCWQRLARLGGQRAFAAAAEGMERRRQWVDDLAARLQRAMAGQLGRQHQQLALLGGRMDGLSPLAVLHRGFARVVRLPEEQPVRRVTDVGWGVTVRVALPDGSFEALVTRVTREGETP